MTRDGTLYFTRRQEDGSEAILRSRLVEGRYQEPERLGPEVNSGKTRVLGRGGRQTVTGVVVNDTLGLSRQERRKIRAARHRLSFASPDRHAAQRSSLTGKLAYLSMLNPEQAEKLKDI